MRKGNHSDVEQCAASFRFVNIFSMIERAKKLLVDTILFHLPKAHRNICVVKGQGNVKVASGQSNVEPITAPVAYESTLINSLYMSI